ncbi:MAG: hypothetical protein KGH72_03380 [Candidatus Micrarchaeota archaeon]|nr:hypothetical protein [Candidatus Micrarchaeota archaeon]
MARLMQRAANGPRLLLAHTEREDIAHRMVSEYYRALDTSASIRDNVSRLLRSELCPDDEKFKYMLEVVVEQAQNHAVLMLEFADRYMDVPKRQDEHVETAKKLIKVRGMAITYQDLLDESSFYGGVNSKLERILGGEFGHEGMEFKRLHPVANRIMCIGVGGMAVAMSYLGYRQGTVSGPYETAVDLGIAGFIYTKLLYIPYTNLRTERAADAFREAMQERFGERQIEEIAKAGRDRARHV